MSRRTDLRVFESYLRYWCYPGMAMSFFLAAAGAGLWLMLQIIFTDHQTRKSARPGPSK